MDQLFYKKNFSSLMRPIIIENNIFIITENNFFIALDLKKQK